MRDLYGRMRIAILLPLVLLAACGSSDAPRNEAGGTEAIDTASLDGLFANDSVDGQDDRLCALADADGAGTFAFVLAGADGATCAGAGDILQDGAEIQVSLTGDEECAFVADYGDGILAFPAEIPASCSYYCSAGASLSAARFDKVGNGSEAAAQALDLVGDALCPEALPEDSDPIAG